jgi:hypothetical protein
MAAIVTKGPMRIDQSSPNGAGASRDKRSKYAEIICRLMLYYRSNRLKTAIELMPGAHEAARSLPITRLHEPILVGFAKICVDRAVTTSSGTSQRSGPGDPSEQRQPSSA